MEALPADLSSLTEVRGLARAFTYRHRRLDVLVNNAGAVFELRCASFDGVERTFTLNHLGHFLLTKLLLDSLRASAPSRVVVVASEAHRDVPAFDFGDRQARARELA